MSEDFMAELAAEAAASEEAPPADALELAQRYGAEINKINERLDKWAIEAKKISDRKNEIVGKLLPDLMDSNRIEKLQVDGVGFEVANYYKASIPSDNPDPGHDWLEEHDHGDLIKNTIVITLPKDSEELAKEIETTLRQRYQEAQVERKRAVPWASLTSWLKELWESTDPEKVLPPLDIMGATVGRIVKVKPKKNKD
jgi:hypothetical protein